MGWGQLCNDEVVRGGGFIIVGVVGEQRRSKRVSRTIVLYVSLDVLGVLGTNGTRIKTPSGSMCLLGGSGTCSTCDL